jgi:glycine hydroxymethyltransferase
MSDTPITNSSLEVHDPEILAQARAVLDACRSGKEMQDAVIAAVKRNEKWRGKQCVNLLAPEAPTSPAVRALLSAEVGTRAAEGNIGKVNRWFAGTQYIDEIESLCVELLKQAFRARYADHRLVASMIGNLTVYTALTEPGDVIMSIAQQFGGHSSNRTDGPAGVHGLKIVDVPMDPDELVVDMDLFRKMAPLVRPKLVALGASMTLFPFPLKEMTEILSQWNAKIFFDGAHQIGLIAGGQFQDPLQEGAAVLAGSAGKTFSGPQSGIIVWDDPSLTHSITHAIFPRPRRHTSSESRRGAGGCYRRNDRIRENIHGTNCRQRASAWGGFREARHPCAWLSEGLHAHASGHRRCAHIRRGPGRGSFVGTRQHRDEQESPSQ